MNRLEAIETIRRCYPRVGDSQCEFETALRELIPELHESEDERIRKGLIHHLKELREWKAGSMSPIKVKEHYDAWIAYLEKQKEQKEEKEPHYTKRNAPFDKCVENCDPAVIKEVSDEVDKMLEKEQKPMVPSDEELQRHHDELYSFKVFAAKQAKEHHISFVHDFEWNNFCAEILSYFNKQKPAEWDEYTKTNLDRALQIIKKAKGALQGYQSDDGIYECDKAIECLEHFLYRGLEIEKLAEWSEEDGKNCNRIIRFLEPHKTFFPTKETKEEMQNWIKNRLKSLRPQPHWKPSEEQMDRLFSIVAALRKDYCDDMADFLANLRADLKKLGVKEELSISL